MSLAGELVPLRRSAVSGRAPIDDAFARRISYLRISLTDRCNYRCTYCMPAEGVELAPRADVLRFEEIAEIVAALREAGVRRVRLTGGEPTVRRDLLELVRLLSALDLDDLALSTNGERLVELAAPLRAAGLRRLNVSLDTLDADKFRQVTRRGRLERVLAGLEAARQAGFRHTKLNTVAMRGFNDGEVGALCRYAFARGLVPRFIELMPMSEGALFYPGSFLPAAELREVLRREFGAPAAQAEDDAAAALPGVGPARYLWVSFGGARHRVGIISAVTEPFCDTCNRVRLSATGQLHTCLARDESADLRRALRERDGAPAAERAAAVLQAVRRAAAEKRHGHEFTAAGCGGPKKHMVSIGG